MSNRYRNRYGKTDFCGDIRVRNDIITVAELRLSVIECKYRKLANYPANDSVARPHAERPPDLRHSKSVRICTGGDDGTIDVVFDVRRACNC